MTGPWLGIFSPTPFLWVQWSQTAAIFFFSDTAISPSDAWVRQQRGGEALFPSDACEDYSDLPNVTLPSKIFPDEVKIKNTVA